MNRHRRPRILKSVQSRITAVLTVVLLMVLVVNIFIFRESRAMVQRINDVFASNATIIQLSDTLETAQASLRGYLSTRSSASLEDFYRYEQALRAGTETLNDRIVDNDNLMLEKNIRVMTESYLSTCERAIQARRGRDVEEYKRYYAQSSALFGYINSYIYALNSSRFRQNSENYQELLEVIKTLEQTCMILIIAVSALALFFASVLVRAMISPLGALARAAWRVADGDFSVEVAASEREDEVGAVTNAFHRMLNSIRAYISSQRSSMEKEAQMKENELAMEAHLKEAQLKFLQAQINPHFLFNSLNAGSQLAMMEGAERTEVFLSRMADFFRYNVKKTGGDASLREELDSVDNYIYILNVRFSGDIHYEKLLDDEIDTGSIRMPSMILQPIVENAVQHGIHDDQEKGVITLSAEFAGPDENEAGLPCVRVTVSDNGTGMTGEQIRAIMQRQKTGKESEGLQQNQGERDTSGDGNSTGVALANVISRLELYYGRENLFSIWSDGPMCGTEVSVLLPLEREDAETDPDTDAGSQDNVLYEDRREEL